MDPTTAVIKTAEENAVAAETIAFSCSAAKTFIMLNTTYGSQIKVHQDNRDQM